MSGFWARHDCVTVIWQSRNLHLLNSLQLNTYVVRSWGFPSARSRKSTENFLHYVFWLPCWLLEELQKLLARLNRRLQAKRSFFLLILPLIQDVRSWSRQQQRQQLCFHQLHWNRMIEQQNKLHVFVKQTHVRNNKSRPPPSPPPHTDSSLSAATTIFWSAGGERGR